MAIIIKNTDKAHRLSIDLDGPDGNAFVLMGIAQKLCRQMRIDSTTILERMMSSDYENLVRIFDDEFGHMVDLYRSAPQ